MPKQCRVCDTELIPDENWAVYRQTWHNYICRSCDSIDSRAYQESHKKQHAAQMKRWRETHREEKAAQGRRWYETHKKKTIVRARHWSKAHPEQRRVIAYRGLTKRRARLAQVAYEPIDQDMIFAHDSYRCVYCGSAENLTLDHIVPVARGGTHTENNLVTACLHCNISKGMKPLIVWLCHRLASCGANVG